MRILSQVADFISLLVVLFAIKLLILRKYDIIAKLLVLNVIIEIIKGIFKQPRPQYATRCDYFNWNKDVYRLQGMPSSHVATIIAMAILSGYSNTTVLILGVLMGWSRLYKKCHTLIQILSGGIIGWVFTALF